MCVTCRNCEAEVANKDRGSHDCIGALKATIARQQATITRQNETITKLERELKILRINDDHTNPYSIERVQPIPTTERSALLGQIEGYDRILAEISARQQQSRAMLHDPMDDYEELKQQISAYSDFVGDGVPQFKNKCPLGHNLHSDIMSSEEPNDACNSCQVRIEECGFIWRCPSDCDYILCDHCRFGR